MSPDPLLTPLVERVIDTFGLTGPQRAAALERRRDVVLTAGAGSGKTRTLVARYAGLLAAGLSPRRVAAITFTKKAAREMRSRVRAALSQLARAALTDDERQRWVSLESQMDSAQIGTIHSLCTEILRAHPAEAMLDPRFEVLDEGLTAVLRAQVLADTTSALVSLPAFAPLFERFGASGLQDLLAWLLANRLEALEIFSHPVDPRQAVRQALEFILRAPALAQPIADLRAIPANTLFQAEGDKLAASVTALLALWTRAEAALAAADVYACAAALHQARREYMNGRLGKNGSLVKETVRLLKDAYDLHLNPLIGGAEKGQPPTAAEDAAFEQLHPLLVSAFSSLCQAYQLLLQQRQALDFDDLEDGALRLLRQPAIRARWQTELDALLVDEFQDTNARQREIVEALAGPPGRLFLVGDTRQSIYRFRRADVTVFSAVQQRVRAQGGLVLDLDLTYRAHQPLLAAAGALLGQVMGLQPDPSRPYYVPFTPLEAHRAVAPAHLRPPFLEFVLGLGENTASARPAAAHALAQRLLQLEAEGQLRKWDEVALLFRASTGFADYEDAFEAAGIPFVTVAGRGFYARPEIRDVLNLLRALSDPADDLAMAGLLRSPAIGLTDAALYQLRLGAGPALPYWSALHAGLSILSPADQAHALRARQLLTGLLPLVDRIPVADLLKRLVDATHYRAILAAGDTGAAGGRLWRNLDKLIGDAQASRQVSVRGFLEYLATSSDAGAREGEAPAEALGAVRLMTIHKSKGLEFPLVVLADAAREPRAGGSLAFLSPELGFTFKLDPAPLLHRLAVLQDADQNAAETLRMLYVALTRAQDRLIISGHAAPSRAAGEPAISGWLEALFSAAGFNLPALLASPGLPLEVASPAGASFRAWTPPLEDAPPAAVIQDAASPMPAPSGARLPDLYLPLALPAVLPETASSSQDDLAPQPAWRAAGTDARVPPNVIGKMVHKAIQLWLFPGHPRLLPVLAAAALDSGLAAVAQREAAVRRSLQLLQRLRGHPLWDELDAALERHPELPYSLAADGLPETGYIDLLYRTPAGWHILDFKTDAIHTPARRAELVRTYTPQIQRYTRAAETLLGLRPLARMCFLDDHASLSLVAVE